MAVPRHETLEAMGIPYVPFTFPTVRVSDEIKKGGVEDVSWGDVDYLYNAYRLAMLAGVAPYNSKAGGKNALAVIQSMEKTTSMPRYKIVAFLNAMERALTDTGAWAYMDPVTAGKAEQGQYSLNPVESVKTLLSDAGEAVGGFLKPATDPVTNLVKYAAVGLVGAAVIYGLWNANKVFAATKKRKKR